MIIYIHGYNSAGGGDKYLKLKQMFPEIPIYSPNYDSSDFISITKLLNEIKLAENTLFIGTSLGGFIAMYLAHKYNKKAILLNPSTNPVVNLQKALGPNTNFVTGKSYEQTKHNLNQLNHLYTSPDNLKLKIYVTQDDEVINYKETLRFFEPTLKVTILENGGHRFENIERLKTEILDFYKEEN
ncbi:MAG: hypothetical protein JEZ09_14495 [Salinivirgaceae bacterium]|nr:hypothetical protein [Salinivirgaceae bacterium]